MSEGFFDQTIQKAADWVANKLSPGGFPTVPTEGGQIYPDPSLDDPELKTINTETRIAMRQKLPWNKTLPGNMPIVSLSEAQSRLNLRRQEMLGKPIENGKSAYIFECGDIAQKIFKRPDDLSAIFEVAFMEKFGGKAGIPEFKGVLVNGYGMELIRGKTIAQMMKDAPGGDYGQVITTDQGQKLLNLVAEFHHTTQRVHGDLSTTKGPENFIIDLKGNIHILDIPCSRIKSEPQKELSDLHAWLTNTLKVPNLKLPSTIKDGISEQTIAKFEDEIMSQIKRDKADFIIGIEGATNVMIDQVGDILIE